MSAALHEPPAVEADPRVIDFLGLRLHDLDGSTIAAAAARAVKSRERMLILNANAHMATIARRQPWIGELFRDADIAFCDGAGVQFAIWLLTGRRPSRTTPPEWIDRFAGQIPKSSSVFWVGGRPEIVERAAATFAARHGVRIAGVQHGYFDPRPGSHEFEELVGRLQRTSPDILLVNMGMPLQERWLRDVWPRVDARVGIAAGALVDHVAGRVQRPPRWVADLGLEWLVRLTREPKRLWRRYLVGLPIFGMLVLRELCRVPGALSSQRDPRRRKGANARDLARWSG